MRSHTICQALLFSLILSFICGGGQLFAQSPIGIWKTIDDESGKAKSHVEIYEKGGELFGKIVKLLPAAKETHCSSCPGDKKDKPLVGMEILWDLEKDGEEFKNGEIMDPKTGKVYSCKIWLKSENTLVVRGYVGVSLLGRSQNWYRIEG